MEHEAWLLELIPLAEEIRFGKGTPEKASRLAELILFLNAHLFNGGVAPMAWLSAFPATYLSTGPTDEVFSENEEPSGVHEIFDLTCFDELIELGPASVPPVEETLEWSASDIEEIGEIPALEVDESCLYRRIA